MPGSNLQTATLQLDCSLWAQWGGRPHGPGLHFFNTKRQSPPTWRLWSCSMAPIRDFYPWLPLVTVQLACQLRLQLLASRKSKAATGCFWSQWDLCNLGDWSQSLDSLLKRCGIFMFDVDAGWLDHTQKTPLHQTAGSLPRGIREPSVPARSESSVCVWGVNGERAFSPRPPPHSLHREGSALRADLQPSHRPTMPCLTLT